MIRTERKNINNYIPFYIHNAPCLLKSEIIRYRGNNREEGRLNCLSFIRIIRILSEVYGVGIHTIIDVVNRKI